MRFLVKNYPNKVFFWKKYFAVTYVGYISYYVTVTNLTYVTDVCNGKIFFPKEHFINPVFDGESHGDLRFTSICRRYPVMT